MPFKDREAFDKLYIKTESGMVEIGKDIEVIHLSTTETEVREAFNVPQEITLPVVNKEILLELLGVCTHKQLSTNNWRKIHGMIMKRGTIKQ